MYIKQQLFYRNLADRQKFLTKYNHLSRLVSVNVDFGVHQSMILRTLKKRTSVKIFTRRKAPKYRDENQKHRAQSNSCALYKILKPDVQLILDNENYFSLNRDISCNRKYYTTDRSTAPPEVKFKTKMKFEPKLLV